MVFLNRKYVYLGVILAVIVVGAVALWQLLPSEHERLVQRTVEAINAGQIEAADQHLQSLSEITRDSIDLTSIMSLRVAMAVAEVIRDSHLIVEYEGMARQFDEVDPEYRAYTEKSASLLEGLRESLSDLETIARDYQGKHYQPGLRLTSPLQATLELPLQDTALSEAYADLLAGEADEADHETLYRSVAREALGVVLRLVIIQDEEAAEDSVKLTGAIDLAELWWLVGTNSMSPTFSEWAIDRVLEETKDQPEHPARARAQEALKRFGRIS